MPDPKQRARRRLDGERLRALARLHLLRGEHRGFTEASRDTNADDEHDPEGATIAFERSQVGALLREAEARVAEIDAAVARLDAGSYGVCTVCHLPIPQERLEARPTALTCVPCAGGSVP